MVGPGVCLGVQEFGGEGEGGEVWVEEGQRRFAGFATEFEDGFVGDVGGVEVGGFGLEEFGGEGG